MDIKCNKCLPEDSGCSRCGGFKVVLFESACPCGTAYWDSPGARTTYEGKRYTAYDGLEIIYHMSSPNQCSKCE